MQGVQMAGPPQHGTSTMKNPKERYGDEENLSYGLPVSQVEAQIRAGFLTKVYSILSLQLLFTIASSAFFMFHEPTRLYVLSSPNM